MPLDYSMALAQSNPGGLGQGIAGLFAAKQQQDLQQAQWQQLALFKQALSDAYNSNDAGAITALAAQYPEYMEQIKALSGLRDEQHSRAIGSFGLHLNNLISAGDTEGAARFIAQNQDVLRDAGPGYEPETLIAHLQQDPKGLATQADKLSLIALGPQKYYEVQNQRSQIETQRRGQDVTMRGQDIQQAEGAADRASRAQIASAEIGVKLQELAQKTQQGGLDAKALQDINKDLTSFNKDHQAMYSAANNLETLKSRNTPASQIAAIFSYMKALDPTSVVREGEQVMVQRTDGVFGTMANKIEQLQSGKMLNAKQMDDLVKTAKAVANTQANNVNTQIDDYLSSYGDTIPASQRKNLEARKAKVFDGDFSVVSDEVVEKTAPKNAIQLPHGGAFMGFK